MNKEVKDKELFERIADTYSRKDEYPVSREARKYQLYSLISLIEKNHFKHILDIGCGPGFNAEYLKGMYDQFTGVDYSQAFIDIAKEKHPEVHFFQTNIKNLENMISFQPDLVLGVGILHHIDDVESALKSIRDICTERTTLAFVEPSNGNPFIQLLRILRKKIDESYNEDQVFYSKEKLEKIFENSGFNIIDFKYQGYFSTPFAQVILKPRFVFYPLCKIAIFLDRLIQKFFNNKFSWNIIVTAKVRG